MKSSSGEESRTPVPPGQDYFAEHGDDMIPVKLIDLASAVARMRQASAEPGFETQGVVHERIFTCDLPRLEGWLPEEARREIEAL